MNRSVSLVVAFAVVSLLGTSAVAQHGGGRPASTGPGMGRSSSGMSHSSGSPGATGASAQSPTTLLQNDHLNTALTKALTNSKVPIPGNNLQTACAPFRNLGQCIAALHVSKNLGISFDCLQADMIGQPPSGSGCPTGTGSSKMSLGKAITTLGPTADAKAEAKKANQQANADLKNANAGS